MAKKFKITIKSKIDKKEDTLIQHLKNSKHFSITLFCGKVLGGFVALMEKNTGRRRRLLLDNGK